MESSDETVRAANGIWNKQPEQYIPMTSGQMNIVIPFKLQLKRAAEQGLLLFVKYGLVLLLAYFALTFGTNVVAGSQNGTQAAIYLNQLQLKGWLPKVGSDGQIPTKEQNATPFTAK